MKSSVLALAAVTGAAHASVSAYGQCGGTDYTGDTTCVDGWTCTSQNPYYYQCVQGTSTSAVAASTSSSSASISAAFTSLSSSSTVAESSAAPVVSSSSSPASSFVASSAASTSSLVTSTVVIKSSTSSVPASSAAASTSVSTSVSVATKAYTSSSAVASSVSSSTSSSASSTSSGKVKYAGINISGFDFGCSTDGTCTTSSTEDPGTTGVDQMDHFVTDDGLNAFRLPVGWQYLVNNELGGTLDSTNFAAYDSLVQSCLDVASLCIVSIHNYARWNGDIIGQSSGSVTDAQFSSLWSQLATQYKNSTNVAFALMNEPHDLTSLSTWATTVQTAVTAIRNAGATSNMILLPGNDWTHASTLISDGSAAALANITNLDGSTTNLIFDVHQYLDSDGSGTSTTCTDSHSSDFETLATWLRSEGRQAMLTETGGSSDSTCLSLVCEELQTLMDNSDVFLGWTGWAAGMFATSYALSETPSGSAGSYTDQEIVTQCIAGIFNSA